MSKPHISPIEVSPEDIAFLDRWAEKEIQRMLMDGSRITVEAEREASSPWEPYLFVPFNSHGHIKVWRFEDAPQVYRALSLRGGDEDWLAFVPNTMQGQWIQWLDSGKFGNFVSVHPIYDGTVYIAAHS